MTWRSDGNVGIGTTDPGSKPTVEGGAFVSGTAALAGGALIPGLASVTGSLSVLRGRGLGGAFP